MSINIDKLIYIYYGFKIVNMTLQALNIFNPMKEKRNNIQINHNGKK